MWQLISISHAPRPLAVAWLFLLATAGGCNRGGSSSSPTGPNCDTEFDRTQAEEKWRQCKLCEKQHRGMGMMEADCKNAIAKPWK